MKNLRRNTYVDRILSKECYQCLSVKPPNANHCPVCHRCIAFMDHHCPWVNNCVGLQTQKVFILFNFYGLISIIYALGIIIKHSIPYFRHDLHLYNIDGGEFLTFAIIVMELITFGLFILVVLVDQLCVVLNRISVIERIKLYE